MWTNYMSYIMRCADENSIPNKKQDLELILVEIKNLTRASPENSVTCVSYKCINNMNW